MQQVAFAIGHFMEATFKILEWMGWGPVTVISLVLGFGLVYWLNLQGKYSRRAKADSTLI